jgi:hypothetical protein
MRGSYRILEQRPLIRTHFANDIVPGLRFAETDPLRSHLKRNSDLLLLAWVRISVSGQPRSCENILAKLTTCISSCLSAKQAATTVNSPKFEVLFR